MIAKIAKKGLKLALLCAIGAGVIFDMQATSAEVDSGAGSKAALGSEIQNEKIAVARHKLKKLWSHVDPPQRGECDKTILTFGIDQAGRLNNSQAPECITVFQSSGSKAMDQYAIVCLKKAFINSKENQEKGLEPCEAIFEIKNKTTSIEFLAEPDFSGYMAELQKKIKHHWTPPKADSTRRIKAAFRIHNDGSVTGIRILNPGIKEADQAATAAIENASPFNPLPLGSLGPVSINFTFDYNVFGANKMLAVKVLNDKNLPPIELSNYIKHLQENLENACAREDWKDQAPIRCFLILRKNGSVDQMRFLGDAGSKTREELATKIIKAAEPFEPLPASFSSDLFLILSFVKDKRVTKEMVSDTYTIDIKITDLPAVKMITGPRRNNLTASIRPYLAQVENKLTKAWNPPGPSKETAEQLSFNIERDGSISRLSLLTVTGDNVADQTILHAAIAAAPFAPLPKDIDAPVKIELESLSIKNRDQDKNEKGEPSSITKFSAFSTENGIFSLGASPFIDTDQKVVGKVSSEIDWRPFLNHIGWRLRQKLKLPGGTKCAGMVAKFTVLSNGDISDLVLQPNSKDQIKDLGLQKTVEGDQEKEKEKEKEKACLQAFETAIRTAAPLWSFPENAPKSIKVECTFLYPVRHHTF